MKVPGSLGCFQDNLANHRRKRGLLSRKLKKLPRFSAICLDAVHRNGTNAPTGHFARRPCRLRRIKMKVQMKQLGKVVFVAMALAGSATIASAMPVAPAVTSQNDGMLVQVRHGHGHGHAWGRGHGHHYGWSRGRHRGWFRHHHRRHHW